MQAAVPVCCFMNITRCRQEPVFWKGERKKTSHNRDVFSMVRGTRLELAWYNHTPLKRARLPIPPLSQVCSEPFLCSLRTLIIIAKAVCYVKPFFKVF